MEAKLTIQDYGPGRKKTTISIQLSPDEGKEADQKGKSYHVDSPLPIPCTMFANEDPAVKLVAGIPRWNGTAYKAYFLQSARRVLLNRPMPGKTYLRIPLPGTLELGFINAQDENRLLKWWEKTKTTITESLRAQLFNIDPQTAYKPTEVRSVGTETQLNPLNPSETKGVRKRCIDEF